jgi:exonuclease III
MDSDRILNWNVRGLNGRARWDMVVDYVRQEKVSLVCLQETKLAIIDDTLVTNMLGQCFAYFYLLAVGNRGGILLAWNHDKWDYSHVHLSNHAVTVKVKHRLGEDTWWLTMVYRLQDE